MLMNSCRNIFTSTVVNADVGVAEDTSQTTVLELQSQRRDWWENTLDKIYNTSDIGKSKVA